MEKLCGDELLQRVTNLKPGEQIFIPDSDGSIVAACEILSTVNIARQAYDNLFKLLMTQDTKLANTVNVKAFMEEYIKNTMVYESTIQAALITAVGIENYKIIGTMPRIVMEVNYEIKNVIITNRGAGGNGQHANCGCNL